MGCSRAMRVCYGREMKTDKGKYKAALKKVIAAKPVPRTSVKATGKRGAKRG